MVFVTSRKMIRRDDDRFVILAADETQLWNVTIKSKKVRTSRNQDRDRRGRTLLNRNSDKVLRDELMEVYLWINAALNGSEVLRLL